MKLIFVDFLKNLCGAICRKYHEPLLDIRMYFMGIYREEILYDRVYGKVSKQAYFLGVPLWGKRYSMLSTQLILGRSIVLVERLIKKELDYCLNKAFKKINVRVVDGRKNVIILAGNSGEIALLIKFFFKGLLANLNCQSLFDFVVLCTKSYHKEMLHLYFPEVRAEVLNLRILERLPRNIDTENWRVVMCFPRDFYVGEHCGVGEGNFIDQMSAWFGFDISLPQVPDRALVDQAYARARKKLSTLQLSALDGTLEKGLVILSFEARTLLPLPLKFQDEIKEYLIRNGYILYENISDDKNPLFLTYSELFSIAEKSAAICALRSGLVDFLSDIDTPLYVYYTGQFPRDRAHFAETARSSLERFSLRRVSKFNPNLKEFCIEQNAHFCIEHFDRVK